MKKTFFLLLLAVMMITACQPKTKTVPVDTAAVKDSVIKVLDKYFSALNARDTVTMFALLVNDGLYCGTDAKELMDKKALSSAMAQAFADTSFEMKYTIDRREIRVAADGNSALSLEQFFMKEWSKKIPVRLVSHLVKTGDGWMIDFFSISFIPNNEDLSDINKALE
jgi:uncharacterized protein (TIGR02246 family)